MKKDLKTLLPVILEAIEKDGRVRIYPRGKSMLPMLREGIDSVVLTRAEKLELYDVVLHKDDDGWCLHRVVSMKNGSVTTCGDNQSVGKVVDRDDVLAKVESWYRGDEHIENDDARYKRYIRRIVRFRPLRRIGRKICRKR
ncbi:MAG: hypothetical protein IJS17_05715 [Clostridia bacterium]|nr:hypothetical protein [Clostridia bacterium]